MSTPVAFGSGIITNSIVSFSAVGSSPSVGQNLTGYSWNFGDGQVSSSSLLNLNIDHMYMTPGVYTCILTVFQDNSTSSTFEIPVVIDVIQTYPSQIQNSTIKAKMGTYIIKELLDFFNIDTEHGTGFVFIGNSIPYANSDTLIPISDDTKMIERSAWDTMIIAKKINPSDVELVAPRNNWTANVVYNQYDDRIPKSSLLTSDISNNIFSMIVINSEGNVYKCLCNNNSGISTQEPTNNYTIADGFISTSDGYLWKYIYNIKLSNKFFTNSWIPVPFTGSPDVTVTEYDINNTSIISGTLNTIVVESGGNNYFHTTTTAEAFIAGAPSIALNSLNNVVENMNISGTGIITGTFITSIDTNYNLVYLSNSTIAAGGGISNPISITTRVDVVGDGVGTVSEVILSGNTISQIIVTSMGINYNRANVVIYGTATSNIATARPIISYYYGHGYNPAIELGSRSLMVLKRFGEIDASEGGLFPIDISFRQYGIMMSPHLYKDPNIIDYYSANSAMSLTLDLTLEAGSFYNKNDIVYQGSVDSPYFSGVVVSQDYFTVKLIKYRGTPVLGSLLTNGTVSRPLSAIKNPDIQPYSGELLYITNINPVQRSDGQSEELKLIITV